MSIDSVREWLEQGLAHHHAGRLADAEACYRQVLERVPEDVNALTLLGSTHLSRGRPEEALAFYDRSLAREPRQPAALMNRGNALRMLGRLEDALASYDGCVALNPRDSQAWSNRGVILADLRRHDESLASCERALAIAPDNAQAHNNRGIALAALGRSAEALASYERAIALEPRDAAVHLNRASALFATLRLPEALASCEKALALRPGLAPALFTRGAILKDLGRHPEALADFEAAARVAPRLPYLAGSRLHLKMQLCDWDGLDALYAEVEAGIRAGHPACHPFALLATPADAALQKRCAEIFVADRFTARGAPAAASARAIEGKIRLGYFSADFHEHPTAYLMAELFELHDRARFELTAFSFGAPSSSAMRRRLEAAFDHFLDVKGLSDAAIAALARERGIDIAVDLKGFTQESRPGIFVHRAAPVQVSYLGYPGTMGAPFIDCVIADAVVLPARLEPHFSERVVRLPGTYQANDRRRPIDPRPVARPELGLPPDGFVFCCFNNTYKITPDAFAVWMRLLSRVPGSVLWLLQPEPSAAERLRRAATEAGVAGERLVFGPRLPLAQHLARLRCADLCLDTLHCGAHTTASDALWAGVPMVTRAGDTFASRVAASLLHAVGLPELAVETVDQYEALAAELATAPGQLAALRARLARQRETSPLFDTPALARHLEHAYAAMLGIP